MPNKCLICYKALSDTTQEYHKSCSKKLFGHTTAPILPYAQSDMQQLAEQIIKSQTTVTGVQAKLSLGLQKSSSPVQPDRLTIMGVLGNFILKPAAEHYPFLPEVEDLSMHLASIAKINTVPHGLIRLQSGKLAYITRRVDRIKGKKRAMEDMFL